MVFCFYSDQNRIYESESHAPFTTEQPNSSTKANTIAIVVSDYVMQNYEDDSRDAVYYYFLFFFFLVGASRIYL